MADLIVVVPELTLTVTAAPSSLASASVALLVQARPREVVPSLLCSSVHPVGPVRAAVGELVVMKASSVSPASTAAGIVTRWLVKSPALFADPTNDSTGGTALACGTGPRATTDSAVTSAVMRAVTNRL